MRPSFDRFCQHLRCALRRLRKSPITSFTVIGTFALGVGATIAIYTVCYDTLLAPDPFPQADQLVRVWSRVNGNVNSMSAGDFLDWQRESHSFARLAALAGASFTLTSAGEPQRVGGRASTPGMFDLLGASFLMGRDFTPDEDVPGKNRVAVLSYDFWRELGADSHIIGRALRLDGENYTVVGVTAESLALKRYAAPITTPLAFRPEQINHSYHWLAAIGRLQPGVTIGQAQSEMEGVARHIAALYPESNAGWSVTVLPLRGAFVQGDRRQSLWLLLSAVALVLLITCANIANLLLAQGASRQHEIAIRGALGASPRTILAQFLVESGGLMLLGGICGIASGAALLHLIRVVAPEGTLDRAVSFSISYPVVGVAVGVVVLGGILFGGVPAWYASRIGPSRAIKENRQAGPAHFRLRRALIVGELALAVALLTAAGLTIHSFQNLVQLNVGLRTDHVLTFRLERPVERFADPAQIGTYYEQMLDRLRGVPGVLTAAVDTGIPLRNNSDGMPLSVVGSPGSDDRSKRPGAGFQSVSPGYYETFGVPVLRGRALNEHDTAGGMRVAMVNQEFARRYLADRDPLGARLSIEQILPGLFKLGPAVDWQIVGVFQNIRYAGQHDPGPEVNVPFAQSLSPSVTIGVRVAGDPASMARSVAAAVHAVDPNVALGHLETLDAMKADGLSNERFAIELYASFGIAALALASLGIYGLISFAVSQRTREIGIRMALGAGGGDVLGLIAKEYGRLVLLGFALGCGAAWFVGRAMSRLLYGAGTIDWPVLGWVGLLLGATAALAAWLPARRATRVDPMEALRAD